MWTETRIAIACALLGGSMLAHAEPAAADMTIGLAQACVADTPEAREIEVAVVSSMVGRDVLQKAASSLCIVRDRRIDLTVATIDTHEDEWKVGWIEIAFAPTEVAAFNKYLAGKTEAMCCNAPSPDATALIGRQFAEAVMGNDRC